jgi:hypothetical protein
MPRFEKEDEKRCISVSLLILRQILAGDKAESQKW